MDGRDRSRSGRSDARVTLATDDDLGSSSQATSPAVSDDQGGPQISLLETPPANRSTPAPSNHEHSRPARLAFYSHDAQGLGHIRRNLNIANFLVKSGLRATILLICGSRRISSFSFSEGIDTLILPAIRKHNDGSYEPRHLHIEHAQLLRCRRQMIEAAVDAFNPDMLLVDKLPLGFQGELEPTLDLMKGRSGCCILGLRDIIDDPQAARQEWEHFGGNRAADNLYDQVWIYGDRSVYDLTKDYRLSEKSRLKTSFTGYLNPLDLHSQTINVTARHQLHKGQQEDHTGIVLCLVGGGQDGYELARLFLKSDLGKHREGIVVTGPFMSQAHRNKLKAKAKSSKRGRFQIVEFLPSLLPLMQKADLAISLGGYNTLCEILACGIPALVIPRVTPRREQLVRAAAFHRLGLLDYMHPEAASRESISDWIQRNNHVRKNAGSALNFAGFATIGRQVESLLASQYRA